MQLSPHKLESSTYLRELTKQRVSALLILIESLRHKTLGILPTDF